jgi:DNA-binding GntR family transcriptional regulator
LGDAFPLPDRLIGWSQAPLPDPQEGGAEPFLSGESAMNSKQTDRAHGTLNDSTYDQIREMILKGSLAPGARIVESELAEHLNVSRTPMRSALHRLQQDGYVLAQGGGRKARLMVAPLTKEDAREIYHIVGALDGLAAWHAARLPERERLALTNGMARINDTIAELGRAPHPEHQKLFQLHGEFHDLVLDAVEAPRLRALNATTKPQADRYRRIYSSGDFGQQVRSVNEHTGIIEAIADGTADRALNRTWEHWMAAADRLCGIIEVLGERGSW